MIRQVCCKSLHSLLVLLLLGCSSGHGASDSASPKLVRVITKKDGDTTHFFVENLEAGEVTATFEVGPDNLKGSVDFPYTAVYPARQTTEAFTLSPKDSRKGWAYSYTNHFTIGNFQAVHDDSCTYLLPYADPNGFRVTQGYNGAYSHSGPDQYAIDFKMPIGTPVHAARAGVVVKVKDDSNSGGPNRKYERCANYILIRHSDGTVANYAHLQKGSSRVKLGQFVAAGERLARSGNTGFTSGPHLHFSVFKTRADGGGRESLPVKFETMEGSALTLAEGRSYQPVLGHAVGARESDSWAASQAGRHLDSAGAPSRN